MPALEATVSEMTEPTNAEEMATFREAKNIGIERGQTEGDVDGHGEEGQEERREHGGHRADPEPHDEQRNHGGLRNRVEADEQRIERLVHDDGCADGEAEEQAEADGGAEAEERGHQRVARMERDGARHLHQRDGHRRGKGSVTGWT